MTTIDNVEITKKTLKPDEPGYIAHDGTIYLGFCGNTPNNYVYAMPEDLGNGQEMKLVEAKKWLENANDTTAYGHKDWDLPLSRSDFEDELLLLSIAACDFNDAAHFQTDVYARYGSKTVSRFGINKDIIIYDEVLINIGEDDGFTEDKAANFRAVRRSVNLII